MTDRNAAAMVKNGKTAEPAKGGDGNAKDQNKSAAGNHKSPNKKRRKVNHGKQA